MSADRAGAAATPARGGPWGAAGVWLVWFVGLASILLAIARDGRNVPFEEDWLMVGPMTGHEADLPRWLWSQNSEHRLPLPRLVNLVLLRAAGDFRATMIFDALAVAAAAAAMILVARRLRGGGTSLADAFFPLLLLHLGNWDNLIWAWQIQFVLPTVLACVLLLVMVASRDAPSPAAAAIAAAALVGLPLSGANGLLFSPTLGLWLAYAVWHRPGDGPPRGGASLPVAAAGLALLLCGLYFVGYESSPWNVASPGWWATLATTGKFVALGLGPVAAKRWLFFGLVAVAVLLIALGQLIIAFRDAGPVERRRILGLAAFFAAVVLMAVAVGWGRAGRAAETGRMPSRYVLLAAPGLCAVYFTALLYGRGLLRRAFPVALAAGMALLYPLNTWMGLERRAWFGAGFAAFEQDLAAGASKEQLAARHHEFMLHWDEALMVLSLQQLHDARIGPFAAWKPEP